LTEAVSTEACSGPGWTALAGAVVGSIVAGGPHSFSASSLLKDAGGNPAPLLAIWVVLMAVYGLAAFRLRRR